MTPPPEWKVVPELATSWEVQDGGKTWVFHLAQGVKFHDGTDFDAQAAPWNFDCILDPEVKSWVRPYYTSIDRVEAVDTSRASRWPPPHRLKPMAKTGCSIPPAPALSSSKNGAPACAWSWKKIPTT